MSSNVKFKAAGAERGTKADTTRSPAGGSSDPRIRQSYQRR
ncbi:hypothetical protein FRUB_02266 [Fimbriiglobus ruber]|uniref:Uncharacterized protein n=1 Tax=Fimbriiglobus ruber TaxID=1908690 RepID=A0A225DXM7_9BACT|nr:hypothetical protein FRUB_02266 [Fimbriiglobus ruber]